MFVVEHLTQLLELFVSSHVDWNIKLDIVFSEWLYLLRRLMIIFLRAVYNGLEVVVVVIVW